MTTPHMHPHVHYNNSPHKVRSANELSNDHSRHQGVHKHVHWEAYQKSARNFRLAVHSFDLRSVAHKVFQEKVSIPPAGPRCTDIAFIEDAAYYAKYAAAAYGWKVVNGHAYDDVSALRRISLDSVIRSHSINETILLDHINEIKEEDLLYCKWKASLYAPSWFSVRDRHKGALVVVIRGTLSMSDLLVDLVAAPVPYSHDGVDGFVHEGMHKAAQHVYPEILNHVIKAYEENPNCQLVIAGHSLGAGVAVLLTLMVLQNHPHLRPTCFAYAPPTVFSENLAIKVQEYNIYSFVLNADIVPRLSIRSLCEYLKGSDPTSTFCRRKCNIDVKMLPPGRIYNIWSSTLGFDDCQLLEAKPGDFDQILSTKSKWKTHLASSYDRALATVARDSTGGSIIYEPKGGFSGAWSDCLPSSQKSIV